MSIFSALSNEEQKPDQGWSQANMFSNNVALDNTQEVIDINLWPTSQPGNVITEYVEQPNPLHQYFSQSVQEHEVPVETHQTPSAENVVADQACGSSYSPVLVQSPTRRTNSGPITIASAEGAETSDVYYSHHQKQFVIVSKSKTGASPTHNSNAVYRIAQDSDKSSSILHELVRRTPNANVEMQTAIPWDQTKPPTRGRGRGGRGSRGGRRGCGRLPIGTSYTHASTRPQQHIITQPQQHVIIQPEQRVITQQHIMTQPQQHIMTQPQQHIMTQPQQHIIAQPQQHIIAQPQQHIIAQPQQHIIAQPQQHIIAQPQQHIITQPQQHVITQQHVTTSSQQHVMTQPQQGRSLLCGFGAPTAGSFAGYTIPKINKEPVVCSTTSSCHTSPSSSEVNTVYTTQQIASVTETGSLDSDGDSLPMLDHGYAFKSESSPVRNINTGATNNIAPTSCTTGPTYTVVEHVGTPGHVSNAVNKPISALKSALVRSGNNVIQFEGSTASSSLYTLSTSNSANKNPTQNIRLIPGTNCNPISMSNVVKIPLVTGMNRGINSNLPHTGSANHNTIIVPKSGPQHGNSGMTPPTVAVSSVESSHHTSDTACISDVEQAVSNSEDSMLTNSQESNSTQTSSISSESSRSVLGNLLTADISKKFTKGTSYIIDHGNGVKKNMMWNGSMFIEVTDASHMSGGGTGDSKCAEGKTLKGNVTGLHMVTKRGRGRGRARRNSGHVLLPNGRAFIHADPPDRFLGRPPIHPMREISIEIINNNSAQGDSGINRNTGESSLEEAVLGTEGADEASGVKRRNEDDGEFVVHCKFCGYTSSHIYSCERCSRKFPDDCKKEPVKRQKVDDSEEKSEESIVTKTSFYGKKIQEQCRPYVIGTVNVRGAVVGQPRGRRINTQGRQMVRITPSRKYVEPVTITVSSDEEEDPNSVSMAKLSNSSTPCVQTTNDTSASSSKDSNKQNVSKQNNDEEDELSKLIAIIPSKRSSSPTFKSSRVGKMEDKAGKLMEKGKKSPSVSPTPDAMETGDIAKALASPLQEPTSGSLTLQARSVKVGSLRGSPIEPVLISDSGIQVYMECEENTHKFNITPTDMDQVLLYLKKNIPVIFIHTTVEFGMKLRNQLDMINQPPPSFSSEPYFDPVHSDLKYQYIVILLQSVSTPEERNAQRILENYQKLVKPKDSNFIEMMSYTESQQLLLKTTPQSNIVMNPGSMTRTVHLRVDSTMVKAADMGCGTNMDTGVILKERSPSPPRITFSGPIERLITYPPPPTPSGIPVTNEDMYCLNEGEFLNDVIIDFYLKYLFLEELSEDVRKRTHIFSSFFFKRLTQRQGRSNVQSPGDAGLTPAEKRHATVKKWTKHVDLFDKDFIIVPINENSHWFLAIICFPGLLQNETIWYVPKHRLEKVFGTTAVTPAKQDGDITKNSTPTPSSENGGEPKEEDKESTPEDKESSSEEKESTPMDTEESVASSAAPTPVTTPRTTPVSTPTIPTASSTPYSSNKMPPKELRGQLIEDPDEFTGEKRHAIENGQRVPCVMVFDSLAGPNKSRIIAILKDYLQVEWNTKKETMFNLRERIRGCTPKVPQQTNYSDCGVYVLQYVQSFFQDPILDYAFPIKCLQTWFTEERMKQKRQEIKDLVMSIKEKNDAEKLQQIQQFQQMQQQKQQQQSENSQESEPQKVNSESEPEKANSESEPPKVNSEQAPS